MKKLLLCAVMMLAVSGLAVAEDLPKWEFFAGYSLLKADMDISQPLYYYEGPSYNEYLTGSGSDYTNGFEFSVTRNLNSWLGIEASYSGHFGEFDIEGSDTYSRRYEEDYGYDRTETWAGKMNYRRHTVVAGPQVSFRNNSIVRPFAHALFGFSRLTAKDLAVGYESIETPVGGYEESDYVYQGTLSGRLDSNTGFAMALGGGLDLKAGKHASIRLIQLDYVPTYNKMTAHVTDTDIEDYGEGSDFDSWTQTIRMGTNRFNNMKLSFGVVFNF